jgi:hypothetical protein
VEPAIAVVERIDFAQDSKLTLRRNRPHDFLLTYTYSLLLIKIIKFVFYGLILPLIRHIIFPPWIANQRPGRV